MADYLPTRDADLDSWSVNFSARVTAGPVALGLVVADATALATLTTAFTAALLAATNPATRTAGTVASKDTARAVLVADIRSLARRIQAYPAVTPAQKADLGLPIHDAVPSPTPAPFTKPLLALVGNTDRTHTIRLVDETTPTRRARPTGTSGAEVYSYVQTASEPVPGDLEQWRFEGLATKGEFDVDYNAADVGKTAYIRAVWYNRKGETGPTSDPITGTIAA